MATRTRGSGNGRYERGLREAERAARAAALRADGWTYPRIAAELGYSSKSSAYEAVQRVLAETVREPADDLRTLELERLNRMYEAAMEVLARQHVTVSQGKVVRRFTGVERDEDGIERLDMDGKPIPVFEDVLDDAPVLAAIDRLLKIQERRARLLGLDAPSRTEVITIDAIEAEIRKLEAEVGNAGGTQAGTPALPGGTPAQS